MKKRTYVRRWHKATPGSSRGRKNYLTADQVRQVVVRRLAGKFDSAFQLYLADERYYLPPECDVKEIVVNSKLDQRTWCAERFDCDDFALVMKAHFCEAAYADGKRRAAHCFGIVWGMLPDAHAINWVITSDGVLRFIEPQTGRIFLPRKKDHGIWFMMA